jgi:uncharacterized protein with PIN domain
MAQEDHPQFIVDSMLGRLARWLRILGFDTWYYREIADKQLLKLHAETERVLLTRDTRLVRCRGVGRHVLVASDYWEEQLREVLEALSISVCEDSVLTRCIVCNRPLDRLTPEEAYRRIPDYVAGSISSFHGCGSCGKVYWAGTHRKRMAAVVSRLRSGRGDGQDPIVGG